MGCKTVYIVPKIIHPSIPGEAGSGEYTFIPDGEYVKLSLDDAKNLGDFIYNKNELIDKLTEYLKYYQDQLKEYEKSIK